MKEHSIGSRLLLGMCMGGSLLCGVLAQEAQVGPSAPQASTPPELKQSESVTPNATPARHDDITPGQKPSEATQFSAGVNEILKMLEAGVSTNVITSYIESSQVAYSLSANDIIALKKRAVPDELTTAMVERGATLRTQVVQSSNLYGLPPVYSGGNRRYGILDPEGYDYFQYYYLYPRTLAYANQRLYAPYGSSFGFAPYSYGFYGPRPFHPLSPSAFRHP